jgi:hypothetical protein
MTYLTINGTDYSKYVKSLNVKRITEYNAQTNAAGDTVVDMIGRKRQIEVGIIPLSGTVARQLLLEIDNFNVTITFLNPHTNAISADIPCIVDDTDVSYYTIQDNRKLTNEFTITFIEL